MPLNKVPSQFRGSYPNNAIASYDYTEISEGTGVVQFDGYGATASGALITYNLSKDAVHANPKEYSKNHANTTGQDILTFDLTAFNIPKTIKGISRFFFTHGIFGSTPSSLYVGVALFKVSNSVETQIGSTSECDKVNSPGNSATYFEQRVLSIDCPQTNFKRGDSLRIKVYLNYQCGNNGNIYFEIDPANAQVNTAGVTYYPSYFRIFVPFKINT